jgi:hypothetical protein
MHCTYKHNSVYNACFTTNINLTITNLHVCKQGTKFSYKTYFLRKKFSRNNIWINELCTFISTTKNFQTYIWVVARTLKSEPLNYDLQRMKKKFLINVGNLCCTKAALFD